MESETDNHNQEKKDHEIGFSCLKVEDMEAEIEKLIVTMTKEDQEEDKDNGKLIVSLSDIYMCVC